MTATGEVERRRNRRRFGLLLTGLAAGLLLAGAIFGDNDGVVGLLGLVCLAYGIGFGMAGVSLAAGWNPLKRPRR